MRPLKAALVCGLSALSILVTRCSKPEDPAAIHRALGNDHARKLDWAAAATEYGLSAQANPHDRKVWELKANAHLRLGQVREAAESLAKPAEYTSDPSAKAESYRLVAGMYVEQKEFLEAEKAFVEALKFDPRDENSLSWLGEFASARGGARSMSDPPDPVWLTKAIAYYDKVIALNPENLFAYVNKRIAISKYIVLEEQESALAAKLIQLERKDASRVAAAQTRLTESTARMEGFKKEVEELSTRIKQLLAAQKAKKQGTG
jgi:tetratricopeptide (TPR) repeat protein